MGRSVLLEAPGRYRIAHADPPAPGPGEALVAVAAAGLCGSDRELYAGTRPEGYRRYPVVPGHEWSGVVLAAGDGVPADLVGRTVVGEGIRGCGRCARCHAGQPNLCLAGYAETGFTLPGAFAEHLLLPAALLHVLAEGADVRAAALLEPAACVAVAVARAAPAPGERMAVVGGGTLGMLAVQFLAAYTPGELLVVDPRPARHRLAERFGATAAVTPDSLPGGGFDLVIETAGAAGSALAATRLARRGGRVVLTGIPGGTATGLPPADLVTAALTVHTVFGAESAAWTAAVRAFDTGVISPGPLVTHELPLEEYPRAVDLLASGRDDVGKVLLLP
ncbi:MAG: zinc-binding dehydrogenase [Mycobacteriales bacterium]